MQSNSAKEYNLASRAAEDFLKEQKYDATSSVEVMEKVFREAVSKFLTEKREDLWTLGTIAEDFEANPSIHLSSLSKEIYLAIDLPYLLLKGLSVDEIVAKLSKVPNV